MIRFSSARDNPNVSLTAAALGSKSYILRSTLHASLLEAAALTDKDLLDQEGVEADDEDELEPPSSYGSILSWSSADNLGGLGLLYVILSLILVNGRSLNDRKLKPLHPHDFTLTKCTVDLKKHLKTLRLPLTASIDFPPSSTHKSMTIEVYLSTFIRQGYLDKVKINNGLAPRATQKKRGRGNDGDDDGVGYEWRWGSRADAEVGEKAIGQFIAEFTVDQMLKTREMQEMPDSDDDGAQRRKRKGSRRPKEEELDKMLENVTTDIVRAAGGKLNDIRLEVM